MLSNVVVSFHPGLRKANTKRRVGGFPRNRSIAQPDELRGCSDHLPRPEQVQSRMSLSRAVHGTGRAAKWKRRPLWPARAAQAADWPRLAGAWRSLRRDLALREAYGYPAGRGLSHLVSHIGVPGQSPVPQQPVPQQMDRCRWAGGVPAQSKPPWQ